MDYYLQTPERFWDLNCARPQINLLHPFYTLAIIAFSPSWTLTWQRWNESRLTISTPNGVRLFFVYFHSKLVCLICNATVKMKSKGIWSGILKECKELRKAFSCQNLNVPQKFGLWKCSFNTAVSVHQNPEPRETFVFYRLSHVLAKHEQPFEDGSIVKEAFLEAANSIFEHFKNRAQIVKAIKEVELSRTTRQAEKWLCMWRSNWGSS